MRSYWTVRPFTLETISLLKAGIVAAPKASNRLQVTSRYFAGMLMGSAGDQEGALEIAETALTIAESDGDRSLQGLAHCLMGGLWETAGSCEESAQSYRAAIEILRPPPESFWLQLAMGELGDRLVICGDIEEALPCSRRRPSASSTVESRTLLSNKAYDSSVGNNNGKDD